MRVFFLGESQIRHIRQIYREQGHQVTVKKPGKSPGAILGNLVNLLRSDTVYQVYGADISKSTYLKLAAMLKKRIVLHWIGTDVLEAAQAYQTTGRTVNCQYDHIDLACAQHLKAELEQIGIRAHYVPITPVNTALSPLPMPEKHAVMAYIPQNKESFYGMEEITLLAERFSEIPFHIVANDGKNAADRRSNIHYHGMLGWEEMKALYEQCSLLVRCTKHDGLPVMILEAMGFGRQVLFRFPFPYAHTPAGADEKSLLETAEKLLNAPPAVNAEGAEYVAREFSKEVLVNHYQEAGLL